MSLSWICGGMQHRFVFLKMKRLLLRGQDTHLGNRREGFIGGSAADLLCSPGQGMSSSVPLLSETLCVCL